MKCVGLYFNTHILENPIGVVSVGVIFYSVLILTSLLKRIGTKNLPYKLLFV